MTREVVADAREGRMVRWIVGVAILVGGGIAVALDQHNATEQLRAVEPRVRSELSSPEIERRLADVRSGRSKTVPWDDVHRELLSKLRQ